MERLLNPNYKLNNLNDAKNILKCIIKEQRYTIITPLSIKYSKSKEPRKFEELNSMEFIPINVNESWGELFDCAYFILEGKINKEDIKDAILALDINGEALLFDEFGNAVKGFTNGSSTFDRNYGEPGKEYYPVSSLIKEDGTIKLVLDAGCNDLFGNLQENGIIKFANIVRKNEAVCKIYDDLEILLLAISTMKQNDPLYDDLYNTIITVRDNFWYDKKDKISSSILLIENEFLKLKGDNKYKVTCVGHAHLDLAWLWPIRETKRKVVRTMTNVLYLLEKYEDFVFVVSQPQQLIWLKENANDVYLKVKSYINEGRIELVGGMFVECDTNVTGEESLVRQMLYGQKFYLEEFGHYTNVGWLPDTFGYSGNLPQIFKKSKQDYFMTTKISWCLVNQFPYHNFYWEGIDNSKILAHLPPEGTYNSAASPVSLKSIVDNLTKYDKTDKSLMVYGIGDGAGGPGDEHLSRIHREENLSILPHAKCGTAINFFKELKKDSNNFVTYHGELYLENHQGTYTSQVNNKQKNRLMEEKLRLLEYLLVQTKNNQFNDEVDTIYKEVLLYQFHDILPGSSIKRVYDECRVRYEVLLNKIDEIINKIVDNASNEYKQGYYYFNPINVEFTRYVKVNDSYYKLHANKLSNSIEYTKLDKIKDYTDNIIDTDKLTIRFEKEGYISSIYDKVIKKEILMNEGNHLRVFRDHGDAWNIIENYRNQDEKFMHLVESKTTMYEGLYEITNKYTYNNSFLNETVLVINNEEKIIFKHQILWKELGYMLHTCFKLTNDSDVANFDIQFGYLSRSRKEDNSINKAQFEVCGQKWCDISSNDYGVSLINNCKYGHYVKNNSLELNLIRSTNYPCTASDQQLHEYSYELVIHEGPFNPVNVDKEGMAFNACLLYSKNKIEENLPINIDNDAIEVSTIKYAYKKDGIIIRLYNRSDKKTSIYLNLNAKMILVDLLEDEIKAIDSNLSFDPFEVKTLWIPTY